MKKCLIVGKFAFDKSILDGQTVKCKSIYDELVNRYGKNNISFIDTYGWKKNPIKLFFSCFTGIKNHEHVIIMPAHNGVKIFAPVFSFYKKIFNRKVHYVVIGSWLLKKVQSSKILKKSLLNFDNIFVETSLLKNKLEEIGFKNIVLMKNFKKLKILQNEKIKSFNHKKIFKLCTFSRVNREKGILDAINTIEKINNNEIIFILDIYGMIDTEFETEFYKEVEKNKKYINYKGVIDFKESVGIISNYDMLLFPTKYYTEGIPGTIIDAYASGVPVLASSWENCNDMVIDNVSGLLFKFNDLKDLKKTLIYAYDNQKKIYEMKKNCIELAKNYCSIDALKPLFDVLDGDI